MELGALRVACARSIQGDEGKSGLAGDVAEGLVLREFVAGGER